MSLNWEALMRAAVAAREAAYAPYSRFFVGAAVLCDTGEIFPGCNVENASYGLSMCAERVALYAACAAGKRGFSAICVAGPPDRATMPCGACRQALYEFNPEMLVGCFAPEGMRCVRLDELLPFAFGAASIARV